MIAFNFICNMTMFWKSWILTFWPPGSGGGGGGGSARIIFATMLHVAAPVIPFYLVCNMTMFWKSFILPLTPPPKSTQGSDTGLRSKVRFDMFLIIVPLSAFATMLLHSRFPLICNMTTFWKSLILTFWPQGPWGGLRGKYLLPCGCICDSI